MKRELTYTEAQNQEMALSALMSKVYLWMTMALAITGLTAFYVSQNLNIVAAVFSSKLTIWGLVIAELAIVWGLSSRIMRMSFATAGILFGIYSILNGVLLSSIFLLYHMDVITQAFIATAGTFGAMTLVGTFVKRDLSAIGRFLFMALIGLIVATVINIFWTNNTLYWAITYLGVLIFCGLTAYDTQKIRAIMLASSSPENYEVGMKLALLGSLTLYLDFINLFLYLLRIFDSKK